MQNVRSRNRGTISVHLKPLDACPRQHIHISYGLGKALYIEVPFAPEAARTSRNHSFCRRSSRQMHSPNPSGYVDCACLADWERGRLHFRSFSIKAELSDSPRAPLRLSKRISSLRILRDCTSTRSGEEAAEEIIVEEETGALPRTNQALAVYRRSAHPATLRVGGRGAVQ
jgi:hypothetical protein